MKRRIRLLGLRALGALLRRLVPTTVVVPGGRPLRVLVLRPDHLGDVLLSRPAIDGLAAALPGADLTVAVGPWGRPALGEIAPYSLIVCPFPGFARAGSGPLQPYLLLARYARLLRRGRYDLALILRPDHWWGAALAALAGIPVRVGYATPETAPFLSVALARASGRHAVEEAIDLADAAARCAGSGVPTARRPLPTLPRSATPADRRAVETLLREADIAPDRTLLVLHPGAGSPLKPWPLERLARVGVALAAELDAQVVVTGSEGERDLARRLCALLPCTPLNLAGRLGWGELEALLARAGLVLGVDSGPLHLAVAAGTPSVALFGPADPAQFGPWGSRARHRTAYANLPCRPCRRLDYCRLAPEQRHEPPCMRGIREEVVLVSARAALRGAGE